MKLFKKIDTETRLALLITISWIVLILVINSVDAFYFQTFTVGERDEVWKDARIIIHNQSYDLIYEEYFPSSTTMDTAVYYFRNFTSSPRYGYEYNVSIELNQSGGWSFADDLNDTPSYISRGRVSSQDGVWGTWYNETDVIFGYIEDLY